MSHNSSITNCYLTQEQIKKIIRDDLSQINSAILLRSVLLIAYYGLKKKQENLAKSQNYTEIERFRKVSFINDILIPKLEILIGVVKEFFEVCKSVEGLSLSDEIEDDTGTNHISKHFLSKKEIYLSTRTFSELLAYIGDDFDYNEKYGIVRLIDLPNIQIEKILNCNDIV